MPADYVNEILKIINFKLKERETKINVKLSGVRVDNLIFSYLSDTLTHSPLGSLNLEDNSLIRPPPLKDNE